MMAQAEAGELRLGTSDETDPRRGDRLHRESDSGVDPRGVRRTSLDPAIHARNHRSLRRLAEHIAASTPTSTRR